MTEQPPLFAPPPAPRRDVGPVEAATRASLQAAQLDPLDAGAGEALAVLAWAMDAARDAGKFYGVAQAGPPYLEQARALGLTVDSRKDEGGDDTFGQLLRELSQPTVGDPAQP